MPLSEKPKWGWKQPAYENEDLDDRLAKVTAKEILQLVPPQRSDHEGFVTGRIQVALTHFYWAKFDEPPPTKGEVIAALDAFRKSTEEFAFCLRNLDDHSRDLIRRRIASCFELEIEEDDKQTIWNHYRALFDEPSTVLALTDFLTDALRTSGMKRPAKKKGRKPDIALIGLIADLAEIYETYAGQSAMTGFHFDPIAERYRGALVDLAEGLLNLFAPDLKVAQNSIGDHIRRVVGDRADPRWQKHSPGSADLPFPWNYDPMLLRYGYEITLMEPTDDGSILKRTIRSEPTDE